MSATVLRHHHHHRSKRGGTQQPPPPPSVTTASAMLRRRASPSSRRQKPRADPPSPPLASSSPSPTQSVRHFITLNNKPYPDVVNGFNSDEDAAGSCSGMNMADGYGFTIRGGIEHGLGHFVSAVERGSEAHLQGLRPGDQIISVDAMPLASATHREAVNLISSRLRMMLRSTVPAASMTLEVVSTGVIPVKEKRGDPVTWMQVANDDEEEFRNEVAELRRQQKVHQLCTGDDEEIRIVLEQNGQQGLGCSICRGPDTRPGIFVQSTRPGGLAAESGIEPGDQVLDCNGVCLQRADFAEAVYLLKNQRRLDLLIRKGAATDIFPPHQATNHRQTLGVQESSGYDSSSTGSENNNQQQQQQQSAKNVIQVKDHRIAKRQPNDQDFAGERDTEKERERERLATLKRVKPDVSGSRLRLEERLLEEERKKLEEEQERLKREAAKLEAEKRRFAEAKSAEAAAAAAMQETSSGGLAGALQEELRRRETNKRSAKKAAPRVPPPPPPPPAGYGTISREKPKEADTSGSGAESRNGAKKTPLANLKNDKHDALMAEFKRAHKKMFKSTVVEEESDKTDDESSIEKLVQREEEERVKEVLKVEEASHENPCNDSFSSEASSNDVSGDQPEYCNVNVNANNVAIGAVIQTISSSSDEVSTTEDEPKSKVGLPPPPPPPQRKSSISSTSVTSSSPDMNSFRPKEKEPASLGGTSIPGIPTPDYDSTPERSPKSSVKSVRRFQSNHHPCGGSRGHFRQGTVKSRLSNSMSSLVNPSPRDLLPPRPSTPPHQVYHHQETKHVNLEQRQLQHQQQLFHAQLHSTRSAPNCSKMSSFSRRHPTDAACGELESFTPFDPFADREVARDIAKPPPFYFESCSRRERISLDRDHGRERCSDFHSVASTTTTSKSVRFSMEQQLEEEEAEAAAAEIYMDYRASMTSSMSTTAAMTNMRRRALMHHGRGINQSSSSYCSSSSEAEQEAATFHNRRKFSTGVPSPARLAAERRAASLVQSPQRKIKPMAPPPPVPTAR